MSFLKQRNASVLWRVYIMMAALLAFMAGCGDFGNLEPIEPQGDRLQTSEYVSELRARPSMICDCPPEVRVFYSPPSQPDCSSVCGRITGPKSRLHDGDDDASQSKDDLADTSDNIRRLKPDDDHQTRLRECYTVCPDWSVVGPHPFDETAECWEKKDNYIDVSAGGSSVLDTRRVGQDRDESTVRGR